MNQNTSTAPGAVISTVSTRPSRTVWLVAGVLAAIAMAAGAGMLMRQAIPAPVGSVAPVAEVSTPSGQAQPGAAAEPRSAAVTTQVPAPTQAPAPVKATRHPAVAAAPACRDCGVVESVRSVTRKGEGSGLGAVAGGVLGAAVGNQMGKGNGRTAMTVLGAVGGGVAGNEVEKRAKSVTVHEVTVRMDDGSLRTIEQSEAPRAGERVIVQGKTLKPAPAPAG